jgi:hypothetical protein
MHGFLSTSLATGWPPLATFAAIFMALFVAIKRGYMVTLAGVEPATCGLGNRRSIHLSYRATFFSI